MLNGASEKGQRLFLLICAMYCRWKIGLGKTTIRQIFYDSGMSNFSPEYCQSLFLELPGNPLIQINSKVEPFTTGNKFNVDTEILIAVNTIVEKQFTDFIDQRINIILQNTSLSIPELNQLKEIQKDTHPIEKYKKLIMFLRKCPRPLFTWNN